MFELLKAYETAKHEENKILRYFYIRYVRHNLKNKFFKPFKDVLRDMTLDKNFLEEFRQLFSCVGISNTKDSFYPYIQIQFVLQSGTIVVSYYGYTIWITEKETYFDITIENEYKKEIFIHPERELVESNFMISEILFMAIYNYCVSYIYGVSSKLYIDDNKYIKAIEDAYF